jgi:hypothetical protein
MIHQVAECVRAARAETDPARAKPPADPSLGLVLPAMCRGPSEVESRPRPPPRPPIRSSAAVRHSSLQRSPIGPLPESASTDRQRKEESCPRPLTRIRPPHTHVREHGATFDRAGRRTSRPSYWLCGAGIGVIWSAFLPSVSVGGLYTSHPAGGGVLLLLVVGGLLVFFGTRVLRGHLSKTLNITLWVTSGVDILVGLALFSSLSSLNNQGASLVSLKPSIGFYVGIGGFAATWTARCCFISPATRAPRPRRSPRQSGSRTYRAGTSIEMHTHTRGSPDDMRP